MKMTGAQIFLEMLRLYEVRHVFGLPGETTLALYKYWAQCSDVRHILTHDERSAAFMAEAYAKVTGKVGVSEAPSPGGTHPAPGVLESQTSAVPTICFTSDVPWNNDKRNMLSGFDQNGLYRPITKETLMVDGVEYPLVKVEISNTSHPFYTGKVKIVDTAGRVDKFYQRYKSRQK